MKKIIRYLSAFVLTVFGLLTLFMSTSVLFDLFGIRAKEGNYVFFVVLANFICAFLYLFAAYGFIKQNKNVPKILAIASGILVLAFAGLLLYIGKGGVYETKTVGAMIFRTSLTIVFTLISYFTIRKNNN